MAPKRCEPEPIATEFVRCQHAVRISSNSSKSFLGYRDKTMMIAFMASHSRYFRFFLFPPFLILPLYLRIFLSVRRSIHHTHKEEERERAYHFYPLWRCSVRFVLSWCPLWGAPSWPRRERPSLLSYVRWFPRLRHVPQPPSSPTREKANTTYGNERRQPGWNFKREVKNWSNGPPM